MGWHVPWHTSNFILGATPLVLEIIGIFKKLRRDRRFRHSRRSLFSTAAQTKICIAFLAELGYLESFETKLFFSKKNFPHKQPCHFFQILVYQGIF